MATTDPDSLVAVYSTPLAFDAEIVRSMLADEDIPSSVENSTGPFPGLSAIPCQVFVTKEHEIDARRLIEEHEALHREHAEHAEDESDRDEFAEFELSEDV